MPDEKVAVHADVDCSELLEKAAHQLANLTRAYHDLARYGPEIMQEGTAILEACEDQLRRLAR